MHLLGSPFDFLIAFLGGVLISFTPCVYPLIPISASYIIGNAQSSKIKGMLLSIIYVSGIAVTYSFLGILAVLTGSIFGKFSSYPAVNLAAGIIIFIFGLSMLDLFHFNFNLNLKRRENIDGAYLPAFLLGLVSGLMISPCLTPVLGSILAYLSITKNIFYGGFLLLSFSFGMGLIFILIGTFGATLAVLPKPGKWMTVIKRICAVAIMLSGIYFMMVAIRRFL